MILLISNQIDGSTCAMMLHLQIGKFYITMGVTVEWAEATKQCGSAATAELHKTVGMYGWFY
jgi:hypothetical protein